MRVTKHLCNFVNEAVRNLVLSVMNAVGCCLLASLSSTTDSIDEGLASLAVHVPNCGSAHTYTSSGRSTLHVQRVKSNTHAVDFNMFVIFTGLIEASS